MTRPQTARAKSFRNSKPRASALYNSGHPAPRVQNNIRVFYQEKNQGKGAALRRGLQEASGEFFSCRTPTSNTTRKIISLCLSRLRPARQMLFTVHDFSAGHTAFCFSATPSAITSLRSFQIYFRISTSQTSGPATKFSGAKSSPDIQLRENRFGFEPEVTAKVAKKNWRIYEVPISYNGRTYAEGKKITWRDGFSAIRCVLRYSLFD